MGRGVISLLYKPTNKPQNHEQPNPSQTQSSSRNGLHPAGNHARHRLLRAFHLRTHHQLNLKTMHKFKTTNIKGKDYVEVNQRLLFFRNEPAYAGWSIESDLVDLQPDRCCIKAIIRDTDGRIRATGHASEDRTSSMINKTSYVENCETSAWGRALACIGIGIETSIASSNEVQMAIAQQGLGDLNDKLGLVPSYDDLTTATLKADFLALLDKLPKEQQAKFMKDIDQMTPARFEKGIQFIQNQLAKP